MKALLNPLSLLLLLISMTAYCQNDNYFITESGNKVFLHDRENKVISFGDWISSNVSVAMTAAGVHYINEKDERVQIQQNKVKELHYEGKKYIKLPIRKSGTFRLHEVVATNDKYILTQYCHNGFFYYIFDKDKMIPLELKNLHSVKKDKDTQYLNNIIAKYFSDCPALIARLKNNIESSNYKKEHDRSTGARIIKNNLLRDVSNFECQ